MLLDIFLYYDTYSAENKSGFTDKSVVMPWTMYESTDYADLKFQLRSRDESRDIQLQSRKLLWLFCACRLLEFAERYSISNEIHSTCIIYDINIYGKWKKENRCTRMHAGRTIIAGYHRFNCSLLFIRAKCRVCLRERGKQESSTR